jgi:formate hydrogenlyase transcriptional activator
MQDLLTTISQLLTRLVPHHFASITLWDTDAKTLRRHALVFDSPRGLLEDDALLRTDRPTPARVAFDRGETIVYHAAEIRALGEHSARVMAAEGLRSACCVPLKSARGVMGTLNFGSGVEDDFDADEVTLLQQIANQVAIAIDNALAYREISALKDRLNEEKLYLEDEVSSHHEFRDIVGKSQALTDVLHQIRTVAPTDATVLLLGETGTGKELLARAVHEASLRQARAFVRVNGAALPANLVESELFGYERGAFTGALASKVGRFELAHHGTLFLDEVGEIPLEVQPKLLRALQEQEFERLGSTRTIRVDVRLIAATNRVLEEMVTAGTFRQDLYYRLNVFPIVVPALRERPEDIAPLVSHFVQKFARELGRTIVAIPASTLRTLEAWSWPGNIRELQNVIERAVILSHGSELRVPASAFKGLEIRRQERRTARPQTPSPAPSPAGGTMTSLQEAEREMILKALREADGVIAGPAGAAARLGLKRTTLHSKMQKLGIARQSY